MISSPAASSAAGQKQMHLGTIMVFEKSSVLSECPPLFVFKLAVIRLRGL